MSHYILIIAFNDEMHHVWLQNNLDSTHAILTYDGIINIAESVGLVYISMAILKYLLLYIKNDIKHHQF